MHAWDSKKAKAVVAMRRFKDEGRLKAGFKLLMLVFYRIIFGEIRSGFFKYKIKNRK